MVYTVFERQDAMMKQSITKYRFKLSDSLLLICIHILNQKRKSLHVCGEESSELNQLILKLIEVSEA